MCGSQLYLNATRPSPPHALPIVLFICQGDVLAIKGLNCMTLFTTESFPVSLSRSCRSHFKIEDERNDAEIGACGGCEKDAQALAEGGMGKQLRRFSFEHHLM